MTLNLQSGHFLNSSLMPSSMDSVELTSIDTITSALRWTITTTLR